MTKTAVATEKPKKRLYLAGPMRGVKEFGYPAFINAAKILREAGYEVFSPAERDIAIGFEWEGTTGTDEDMRRQNFSLREALGADLDWISHQADGIALLPGWQNSSGANAELATAIALGLDLYLFVDNELVDATSELQARSVADHLYPQYTISSSVNWSWPDNSILDPTDLRPPKNEKGAYISTSGSGFNTFTHPKVDLTKISMPNIQQDIDKLSTGTEVRTTSSKGGQKGVKLADYSLIPVEPLRILAEHYGRGARKYSSHQWMKGYEWSKSFSALMRHAWQFWNGEDFDTDEGPLKGSPHMAAVAWHAFALLQFMIDNRDLDDRPKPTTGTTQVVLGSSEEDHA